MKNLPKHFSKRRKIISKIFIPVFLILIFIIISLAFYAPFYSFEKFNNLYYDSLKFSDEELQILKNDEFFELKKHEAYLKSKLLTTKSDSIYLSLNIPDSLISIGVQGVILHQVKILNIKKSCFFDKANRVSIINFFETPLTIKNNIASIKKEPVVYKKAPKDTIEAGKQSFKMDTLDNQKVFLKYILEKNLNIEIVQSENKTGLAYFNYKLRGKRERLILFFTDLLNYRVPGYTPVIKIELRKDDIKSIYRALPEHALVSLKI